MIAPGIGERETFVIHDDQSALDAVLLRIRLRARRRLLWLRAQQFDGSAEELDILLEDRDAPEAERIWQETQCDPNLNAQIDRIDAALAADDFSRLAQLCRVFALDPIEVDILHLCLASAIEPAISRLYAYLQDNASRAVPTLHLAGRLFGYGRSLHLGAESSACRWRMIRFASSDDVVSSQLAPLSLDPHISGWLSSIDDLDPFLVGRARLVLPYEPLPEWDVARVVDFVGRSLKADSARTVLIHLVAAPGSGRKTFAANVAARLGMPLLAVDAQRIGEDEWETLFIHAQRHAFLHHCALAWTMPPLPSTATPRRWTPLVAHFPFQFLIREANDTGVEIDNAVELHVGFPALNASTRLNLWRQYAPGVASIQPDAVERLAARKNARPGDIAAAARVPDASPDGLARALSEAQQGQLDELAVVLECPFGWDDLIVPDSLRDSLFDFVHEAGDRNAFWESPEARRMFPQGRGLAAMFSGSPGTGKTMAAQVIAAALGLDLFRVDLSAVISKYVGETSQNLQRILSRAAGMDVILFFDEADALFARRTEVKDAHDRFANTDTNHLLQAIEQYDGIVIMATNRKGGVDPAFFRRLRYVLDFPKPDAAQREALWMRITAALAGDVTTARLRPVVERLAVELEMTGAQIKYAVLSATFAARRDGIELQPRHLMLGLDRELAKEGRGLNDRQRARLA